MPQHQPYRGTEKRLSLTPDGSVRYQYKTPYRDGNTHVIFEPLDIIARLAALVPKPRDNLTRFHGVFAPNSNYGVLVTSAKRGTDNKPRAMEQESPTPAECRASMTWAQRLKWLFRFGIDTCQACSGQLRIIPEAFATLAGQAIGCIGDTQVIRKIPDHLRTKPKPM